MINTNEIRQKLIISYFTEKYDKKIFWWMFFPLLLLCGYFAFFFFNYELTNVNILCTIFFSIGLCQVISSLGGILYIDDILKTVGPRDYRNIQTKLEKKLEKCESFKKYLEQELAGIETALNPAKNKLRRKYRRNLKRIFILQKEIAMFNI